MNGRHLASTQTTRTRCVHCNSEILTALDEGERARVDPDSIDPADEVGILLDGRRTYILTPGRWLIHREADRIRAATIHGRIHAQHRCDKHEGTLF
jgi:hypothetical protein